MYRNTQLRNNYFRYKQQKSTHQSLYKWEALAIAIVWVGGVLWSNAMKEKHHNMPIQELQHANQIEIERVCVDVERIMFVHSFGWLFRLWVSLLRPAYINYSHFECQVIDVLDGVCIIDLQ